MANDKLNFHGTARKVGDDIDTDAIIHASHMINLDPAILARHCLEEAYHGFHEKVRPGDILVAGRNFGCGSSREQAPLSIKYAGIDCIIAVSFSRLFYRNAINLSLPIVELPECASFNEGDEIVASLEAGVVRNITQGTEFRTPPVSKFVQEIFSSGGLLEYVEKKAGRKEK